MDENHRVPRKAQIAELQLALKLASGKLDELEKRRAARDGNRLASQVAIVMTKAGIISNKS